MGRAATYIILLSGIMLLFYISGLIGNTPNNALLNLLLDPTNIQNTQFNLLLILSIEGLAAAGAVIIGISLRDPTLAFSAAFVIFLTNFFLDALSIYLAVREANEVLALLIFSPIILLMMVTIFEFWRGTD